MTHRLLHRLRVSGSLCATDQSEFPIRLCLCTGSQGVIGRKTRAKLVCVLWVCGCLPMFPSNKHILIFILEVFVRFIGNERVRRQKQNDIRWAGRTVPKSTLKSTLMSVCFSGWLSFVGGENPCQSRPYFTPIVGSRCMHVSTCA